MFEPQRKYRDKIRNGAAYQWRNRSQLCDGRLCRCRRGRHDYSYHNDPGLAARLTQVLVQQGWPDARIRREHLRWTNKGFTWVRHQDDPQAASQSLIDQCDRTRKPYIPMRHRHRIILSAIRTGEIWTQKKLLAAVGHSNDGDVRNDIRELERSRAIVVTIERHGDSKYAQWKRISLAVTVPEFHDIALDIRRALAKLIRKNKAILKGCRRTTEGRAAKPVTPMTELEDREIDLETGQIRQAEGYYALFGEPMPGLDPGLSAELGRLDNERR